MIFVGDIIRILSDGQFHSGPELGERLGISRAGIWKTMKKLEEIDLRLERKRGVGYRIPGGLELLSLDRIKKHIEPAALVSIPNIELFTTIDSSNSYARGLVGKRSCSGTVILAEHQTAGRGRHGKHWYSSFGGNILLSMIWEFEVGVTALQGISLAVGVIVRRALVGLGVDRVQLKWPNDLCVSGRKLGGILLEVTGDLAGPCSAVIGIGVNYKLPKATNPIDQPWTDVWSESRCKVSRNELCAVLLNHMLDMLKDFEFIGFSAYREEWQRADALRGKYCTVRSNKELASGTVVGVDHNGALILRLKNGQHRTFSGGELSLRLAP